MRLALLATGLLSCFAPLYAQTSFGGRPTYTNRLAPYVPSPQQIVDRMLEAANLKPGEVLYDLGCGDGRVLISAAQKYRAKAVGIELSEPLVKEATDRVKKLKLDDQITILQGDLMKVDLNPADVVIIYLETSANDKLRPNLEKYLKPGARVVSHDFEVRGWKPVHVETLDAYNRAHKIYVYEMSKR